MHICLIAIKVKSGTIWQTIPQIKGEEGESAYEIAVRNGFEGTEEEWLEYLRQGPQGEDGLAGRPGDNYQFIFKRTDSSNAPFTPESATDVIPETWSAFPLGVNAIAKYEWVSVRVKVDNVWGEFSAPALWAIYGFGDSLPEIYIEDIENLQDVLDDLQNQIDDKISKSLLPDPNTVKLPGADIYGVVLPKYLPIATANSLGAIKVGSTLTINAETGVLNTNIGFRNLTDGALEAEPPEGASIVWNSTSKKYVNTVLSLSGTYHPYLGKDAQGNKYDLWANILRPDTLILPQTPPVVSNNEVAIYGLENGYTIVEPDPVDNKLLGDLEDVTIGTLAQYDSIFRVGNEFVNLPAYTKSQINALFTGADGKYHPLYGKNDIDFIAKTLRSVNLVIPQSVPNFSPTEAADGEVALYARESGYTIENPDDYVTQFTELTDVASLAWTEGQTLVFKNNAFSNYPIYTKTEVDTLIQNVGIDGYYNKDYIDSHFHPIFGLNTLTQLPLNFNANILKSNTLLLSKALPTITNDEIALYAKESGYTIATPETNITEFSKLTDVEPLTWIEGQVLLHTNNTFINTSIYTKSQIDTLIQNVGIDGYYDKDYIDSHFHPILGLHLVTQLPLNFNANILKSNTLLLSKELPTIANDEIAIYATENGYSISAPEANITEFSKLTDVESLSWTSGETLIFKNNVFSNYPIYTKNEVDALLNNPEFGNIYDKDYIDSHFHPILGLHSVTQLPLNFNADILKSKTLVIPKTSPTLENNEIGIYGLENGYTIATPEENITEFSKLTDIESLAWTEGQVLLRTDDAFINTSIYTKSQIDTLLNNPEFDNIYNKDYINTHFHPIFGLNNSTQLPLSFNADVLKSNTLIIPKILPTIANDEIGIYGLENGYSIATPETSPVTLEELTDVNLIGSSDKQALLYNIANQSWENTSLNFDMIDGNLNANRITQSELLKFVSDSQITAWDAKWNFDANTIKAIEVNNAINSSKLGGQLPSFYATAEELSLHISDTDNPHNVTIEQIGAAPETGSANYIQNQLVSAQTADYWISGKAKSGILIVPTNTPIISNSEVAIFAKENGYTIATPEESPVTLSALLDVDLNNEQTSDVLSYSSILQSWVNSPITFNTIVGDLDPARISQSETYRFVTDAEKILWTAKQAAFSFVETTEGKFLRDDNTFQYIESLTSAEKSNFLSAYNHSVLSGNPHLTKLNELSDVNIISNSNGEILKWNGTAWINNTLSEAGISAIGHTHDDRYYTETEIGNFFSGATAIVGYNKSSWDTAHGWGNHASAGYASATNLSNHINDATSHLTSTEKTYLGQLMNYLKIAANNSSLYSTLNFYSESGVSAFGIGTGGGGGGTSSVITVDHFNDISYDPNRALSSYAGTRLNTELSNKQPLNAQLTALSGLTGSGLVRKTGIDSYVVDSTSYATVSQLSGYATTSSLSNYLPLSGGILSMSSVGSIIFRKTSNNTSVVKFEGAIGVTNTAFGYLGFDNVDKPVFINATNSTVYNLYHSGNSNSSSVPWAASTFTEGGTALASKYAAKSTTLSGYGITSTDTLFDSKYIFEQNAINPDATKTFPMSKGLTISVNSAGSTNFPDYGGFVDFSIFASNTSAAWGRDFTLWKWHSSERWYLRGYSPVDGSPLSWREIWHSGNLLNIGATASSARTALGLGTMATETASNYLTTATAASTYLPLSGGKINGTTANPLIINTTHASQSSIDFQIGGVWKGAVGYYSGQSFIQNANHTLRIYDNGDFKLDTNIIYHSANSNRTTIDWSAKDLTLAGSVSGATTGTFSSSIRVGNVVNQDTISVFGGYGISNGSARYGNYGQIILDASSGWTAGARRWLITNAYQANKFAIIRSINAETNPSLTTSGEIGSGFADFIIDANGAATFSSSVSAASFISGGNAVLHAGNYSSYALSLSGGTMNDTKTISWNGNVVSWDDTSNGFKCVSNFNSTYSYHAGFSFKGYYGLQLRTYAGGDTFTIRGHNASNWGAWREIYHSGNSNLTSVDWSANNLTLAGALSVATTIAALSTITATGNILSSANVIANTGVTVAQTGGTGVGISLYSAAGVDSSTNPTYGLMFATTASKGTHGAVTGDWATYFTMSNTTGRGWIFTTAPAATTGNVASISNAGVITAPTFIGALDGNAKTVTNGVYTNNSQTISGAKTFSNVLTVHRAMSDFTTAFTSPHIVLSATGHTDTTGFVGISYATSSDNNYGWSVGSLRSTNGNGDFVFKNHVNSTAGNERLRISGAGIVTASNFVGALSGNASTATKLQNSRTIWGQSFDGSGNITGALSGATTIAATTSITAPIITATTSLVLNGHTLTIE